MTQTWVKTFLALGENLEPQ